jgi:protein phosphatase
MVRSGELSAEEAAVHPQRHILTRALGIDPDVEVDVWHVPPHAGDRILLCSDGLINEMGDDEIASVLGQHPDDPGAAANALVSQARDAGGNDNITVVVVDIVDDGDGQGGAGDLVASTVGATAAQAAAEGARAGGDGGEPVARDDPNPTPTHDSVVVVPGPVGDQTEVRPPGARVRVRGRSPRVTLRVVAFIAVLLMVLAGISAAVWWFAERSYFVGLQGNQVAIFKGRPGGLLWIHPSVTQRTALTTSTVLPARVADLRAGKEEPTLAAAQQYVNNLAQEAKSLPTGTPGGPSPPATAPAPAPPP